MGNKDSKKKVRKRRKRKTSRPVTESSCTVRKDGHLISTIHNLMKAMDTVKRDSHITDAEQRVKINDLKKKLDQHGGLDAYQTASKLGEERHGKQNTSKWVLKQLNNLIMRSSMKDERVALLDVGALQNNYVNQSSWIDCVAIDLNPCNGTVQKADFLTFTESKKFDVIVLSLVINFVGNAVQRGNMLQKCRKLCKLGGYIFFIVPVACLMNSRYLDDKLLIGMFESLGFVNLSNHASKKLSYKVFQLENENPTFRRFPKTMIKAGRSRNNFAIII